MLQIHPECQWWWSKKNVQPQTKLKSKNCVTFAQGNQSPSSMCFNIWGYLGDYFCILTQDTKNAPKLESLEDCNHGFTHLLLFNHLLPSLSNSGNSRAAYLDTTEPPWPSKTPNLWNPKVFQGGWQQMIEHISQNLTLTAQHRTMHNSQEDLQVAYARRSHPTSQPWTDRAVDHNDVR